MRLGAGLSLPGPQRMGWDVGLDVTGILQPK